MVQAPGAALVEDRGDAVDGMEERHPHDGRDGACLTLTGLGVLADGPDRRRHEGAERAPEHGRVEVSTDVAVELAATDLVDHARAGRLEVGRVVIEVPPPARAAHHDALEQWVAGDRKSEKQAVVT